MANGSGISMRFCGPSTTDRSGSVGDEPITNAPAGTMRTIGNESPSRNAVPPGLDALTNVPSTTGSPDARWSTAARKALTGAVPVPRGAVLPGLAAATSAIHASNFRQCR